MVGIVAGVRAAKKAAVIVDEKLSDPEDPAYQQRKAEGKKGIVRKVVFSHLFNLLTGKGRKGKKKGAEQQEEAAAVAGGADAPAGAVAAH